MTEQVKSQKELLDTIEAIESRLRRTLIHLAQPIPSTKGMAPKDRADRLHSELQRRIKAATEALN